MSVTITVESVRSAIKGLTALSASIESQRHRVSGGTPVSLPSMADGGSLAQTASWIDEQLPDLQAVLDIGILLETEGSGVATLDVADLSLDDASTMLGTELGKRIGDDDLQFRTPADREKFELYAQLMGDVANNPDAIKALMKETGPAGPTGAMYRMMETLNQTDPTHSYWVGWEYSGEAGDDYDSQDERQKFEDMAALFAQNSALMVANGSRNGAIPADGGKAMFESGGPLMSTILLKTANDKGYEFGGDFLGSMGEGLSKWEEGSYTKYVEDHLEDSYWPGMRTGNVRDTDYSPLEELLDAGNRSTETRQGLAGNDAFLKYMLTTRQDEDMDGVGVDHFDDILQRATVEVAEDPAYSRKAAEISSSTIKFAGEADHVSGNYDDELGGIVAMYINDVDRAVAFPDHSTGAHSNGPDGVPPYGIDIDDLGDVTGVLHHVGDSDTAVSMIGDSASKLNQLRLDQGATSLLTGPQGDENFDEGSGDPFHLAIRNSTKLRGYLEDELAQGRLDDAKDEADARRQVAGLFTLPLDAIPLDKLGPVGSLAGGYAVDQVKDQIIENYVGHGVADALGEGNAAMAEARNSTKMQALAALVNAHIDGPVNPDVADNVVDGPTPGSHQFDVKWLRDHWPQDASKPTDAELRTILQGAGNVPGLTGDTYSWVDTDWDSAQLPKGNRDGG